MKMTGVLIVLLVVFLIWAFSGNRSFSRNSGQDIKTSVQDMGQEVKSAGREVADSIRRTVQ